MQAYGLAMRWAESELNFLAQQRGATITFPGGDDLSAAAVSR
jgi:hypothetical protein